VKQINTSNKIIYLIIGSLINSLFILFFGLTAYASLEKIEFSYLTGLFILESILIVFDLSINNYIIKFSSSKKNQIKQNIINFFLKKIIIFSLVFFFFNLFILKKFFWDKVINQENDLGFIIAIIVSAIIIVRVFINFLKAVLIGNSEQIKTAKIQIISALFKFIFFIFFLFYFKSIVALLITYLFCFLIELFIYFSATYKKYIINFFFFKNYLIKENYISSLKKIFILSVSIIIFFNVDRIFLSYKIEDGVLGEYNFIRTLLLGFFIISSSYYYTLLPDISRLSNYDTLIEKKIINNFKSLNIILVFCIIASALFFEKFLHDFQLNLFFKIDNFLIFKIILIATYFNMLSQIFLSFQIANSYFTAPAIINFAIIIVSLIFINPLFSLYGVEGVAFLYLLINVVGWICNAVYLYIFSNKIFTKKLMCNILKILIFNFIIIFSILITLDALVYNFYKFLFYLILGLILFYVLYLSQKFLKNEI
jgi:O-antigen/teichoic acid export membrane protein